MHISYRGRPDKCNNNEVQIYSKYVVKSKAGGSACSYSVVAVVLVMAAMVGI
jgi:hypothetical protein